MANKNITQTEIQNAEDCLKSPTDKITKQKEFGITDSCPSAGWITPEGNLIDLAYGGAERIRDHREIQHCMPETVNRDDVLEIAQNKIGLVRMAMPSNRKENREIYFEVNAEQPVSNSQWRTLKKCAKDYDAKIIYDIYVNGGRKHSPDLPDFYDLPPLTAVENVKKVFEMVKNGYTDQEISDEYYK